MTLVLAALGKATVLLAAGFAATGAMRRSSAASRHVVWVAVLGALLVLPAASATVPSWPVLPFLEGAPPPAPNLADVRSTVALGVLPGGTPGSPGASTWKGSAAAAVGAVWAVGVLACIARLLMGWAGTRRLEREAAPLDDLRLRAEAEDACLRLGVRAHVQWLTRAGDVMPLTWGLVRPRVLLPASAVLWAPERARAVITHEVAHVARRDLVWHLFGSLAVCVWWWHPLAWLAARRARLEREHACDDLVLAGGARASDYAADLVEFVAAVHPARVPESATVAMARRSHLERRVMAILDDGINRRGVSAPGWMAAVLVVGLVWPLAAAAGRAEPSQPQQPDGQAQTRQVPAGAVRVGGDIREPIKIKDVKPAYPPEALAAKVAGIVILEALIGEDGSVDDVRVLRSVPLLDEAARDAVSQWRFRPTLLNGVPTPVIMTVTVNFRPDEGDTTQAEPIGAADEPVAEPPPMPVSPATWAPGDPPLRVGGAIREPKKIKDVKPVYPPEALSANVGGIVILELLVNEEGVVDEAKVLRSIPMLDEAARDAVLQWKFTPTLLNGAPVPVILTVTVNFQPQR